MIIRKAKLQDVEAMMSLINDQALKGLMLPRTRNSLYEGIREFLIVEENDKIVGVGGLHILWDDLAEIRALAIDDHSQGKGIGKRLVNALLEEATELGCPQVFTLTYQIDFFKNCGFTLVNKEDMPHKVWKECIHCIKFPNCDENAMIYSNGEKGAL